MELCARFCSTSSGDMRFPRSMFDLWLRNHPTYLPTVLHIASCHATDIRTIISLILPRYFSPNATSLLISKLQKGDFSTLLRSWKFFVYLYINIPEGTPEGTPSCAPKRPLWELPFTRCPTDEHVSGLTEDDPLRVISSCVCWIRRNFKPYPHYAGEIWNTKLLENALQTRGICGR